MLLSCLIGLYIFAVYKLTSKAAFYSKDLNITMAGMPVIVAAIMIAMQSNLIVSLGMVGALSIVRFRSAIKNPLDLLYLFWAVSAGIICGVGLSILAFCLCIVMTVMLAALDRVPNSKAPALLVLCSCDENIDWKQISEEIKKYSKYHKEKSRSLKNSQTEVIYEIKTSREADLVNDLHKKYKFDQVHLVKHDGEYRI